MMWRSKIIGSSFLAGLRFATGRGMVCPTRFTAEGTHFGAGAIRTIGVVMGIQVCMAKAAGARTRTVKMIGIKPGAVRRHSGASVEGRGPGREGSAVITEVFRPFHGRVWPSLETTCTKVVSFRAAVAHTLGTSETARSAPQSPLLKTGSTWSAGEVVGRECGHPVGSTQAGSPTGWRRVKPGLILLRSEMRMMRGKFGDRQFSVAVAVKLPQRGGSIGDFVRGDDPVPIGIKRGLKGRTRGAISRALIPWAGAGTTGGSVRGRIGHGPWGVMVLGRGQKSGDSQGDRRHEGEGLCFHIFIVFASFRQHRFGDCFHYIRLCAH